MIREYKTSDKFVFFMQGPLGNWYGDKNGVSEITIGDLTFRTSEHLFMYLKAMHFGDKENMNNIISDNVSAYDAKNFGRQVKDFVPYEWDRVKKSAMMLALRYKFDYCEDFRDTLLAEQYRGKTFVECNMDDTVWAIGRCLEEQGIEDPSTWRGQNLLGQCLTELRDEKLLDTQLKNNED